MKTDNLTMRERLIDFTVKINNDLCLGLAHNLIRLKVDNYLKSINQSSNEALTLDTIEGKEKKCDHHYLWDYNDKKHCEFCGYRPDDD